jgi:hypothetical protein
MCGAGYSSPMRETKLVPPGASHWEHVSTVTVAADSKVWLCCCLAVRARGQVLRCLQEDCESWIEGINQSMHL